MTHLERFHLNDADTRFLISFTKHMQKSRMMLFVIVLIFILAASRLALGIRYGYKIDFLMAYVFAVGGITVILVFQKFKRLYSIVIQMQEHIARLESGESQE